MSKIENRFRDEINNRKVPPSAEAWNQLSRKLDEHQGVEVHPPKAKNGTKYAYWLGGVAACVLILALVWRIGGKNHPEAESMEIPSVAIEHLESSVELTHEPIDSKVSDKQIIEESHVNNQFKPSVTKSSNYLNNKNQMEAGNKPANNPILKIKEELVVKETIDSPTEVASIARSAQQDSLPINQRNLASTLVPKNKPNGKTKTFVDKDLLLFSLENKQEINSVQKALGLKSFQDIKINFKNANNQ